MRKEEEEEVCRFIAKLPSTEGKYVMNNRKPTPHDFVNIERRDIPLIDDLVLKGVSTVWAESVIFSDNC